MTNVAKTYNQKRAQQHNMLQEAATNQINKRLNDDKSLREAAHKNTFTGTFGRSSRTVLAKRQAMTKQLMAEASAILVCNILREAVPFDLSNVSDRELIEQINAFKDAHSDIINEATLLTPASTVGVDTSSHTSVALFIGGRGKDMASRDDVKTRTPLQLARDVLSVNAACSINNLKDANISSVINTIDTSFCYGSEAEKQLDGDTSEHHKELSGVFKKVHENIGKQLGEAVRGSIAVALKEDADRKLVSDEERFAGLTEATVERMKMRERKKPKHLSLVEEVFKTVSVLNESHGATSEDYLNEAVFQFAILETYALLGCVNKTPEEIALSLHGKRLSFSK